MALKRKGRNYRSSRIQVFLHHIRRVIGRIIFSRSIKQNRDTRILVVCHLFYMDAWPSIKHYLENLSPYNYHLIVTYTTEHFDTAVLEAVREFKKDAHLVEYPNRGYDIGGLMDILTKTNLNDYDIVYKLHSKGVGRDFIFIYDQVFKKADWFLNLFDGILGEFSVHKTISILMHRPDSGLVASANLIVQDPPHKKSFTCEKASQLGIPINEDYRFVAGSCFAVKASLLSCVQSLNLTIDSFTSTRRGSFSLAHAMERIVCATIETQGKSLVGIRVPHPVYPIEREYRRSISALRLLEDERFHLDYDYFYKKLEMVPVFSYDIKSIRLGDIRRYWEGKYFTLRECSPYAYVCGDIERYEKYIAANKEASVFETSRERYDWLIKSLEENGFDEKMLPIVCAYDNTIWDGQHRCCWLLAKYGADYMLSVLSLDVRPWYLESTGSSKTAWDLSYWERIWRAFSSIKHHIDRYGRRENSPSGREMGH